GAASACSMTPAVLLPTPGRSCRRPCSARARSLSVGTSRTVADARRNACTLYVAPRPRSSSVATSSSASTGSMAVTVPSGAMTENERKVSVERVIAAPPEKIFDVLADPSQHPVIDGSGTVKHTRGQEPDRLSLGAKFGMSMRIGVPYVITNTVVEFDENRLIAWRHVGGHRWRYELETVGAKTRVRETYDWSTAILPTRIFIAKSGWPTRTEEAMTRTLERLDAHVTGGD